VKRSEANITWCPWAFRSDNRKDEKSLSLGWTLFHELMHIVSAVRDKGYTKEECFENAKNDPSRARLNAAAYEFFAQEVG
jgi:hypothetical protein